MANLLALTAIAVGTNMKCSWDLTGSLFTSVTSIVLTYTDLSTNEWTNVAVGAIGIGNYEEVVSGLTAGQAYKVYITVFGKNNTANLLKLSEVKYVTAEAPPALPTVTILSGPTYLQLLFKNADGSAYDFTQTDLLGFVVSCNNVSDNHNTSGSNPSGGQSAKDFTIADVKQYVNFSARTLASTAQNEYTYSYVVMKDLAFTSEYEVAITYYDETGFRPLQNLTTSEIAGVSTFTPAQTNSVDSPPFTAYALNNKPEGNFAGVTTPTIIVNWRNPVAVIDDALADIPQVQLQIVRQKKVGVTLWEDDGTIDLSTHDVTPVVGYEPLEGGQYKYTDTTGLVAAGQYRYTVTMQEFDGTTTTPATTNEVVALITPTVALPAAALTLNVNTGSIQLDAPFSDIVTNNGGFSESDFDNTDFKLGYKLGEPSPNVWSYKDITIADGRVSTAAIARGEEQKELTFKIEAIPKHSTTYPGFEGEDTQDITSSRESSELSDNYNTILPGAVTNFTYTNAVSATTASASFKLEWSNTDNSVNTNSAAFYRVVAKNDSSNLTFNTLFSTATLSRQPFIALNYTIAAVDGKLSYTFDTNTPGGFFVKGQSYSFTIQRTYIDDNTISRTGTGFSGDGVGTRYLLGPVAGGDHDALRMFENPPTPVPTAHVFDHVASSLSFTLDHATYPSTHGFLNEDTTFNITVKDSDGTVFFTGDGIAQTGTKVHTVDMTSATVGSRYTLTVKAHNDTTYLGHTDDTNSFYSTSTADFHFVKEGPVGTSASLISYNSLEGTTRGTDLKVEWSEVTDAATYTLGAAMYYILEVTNATTVSDVYPLKYLKQASAGLADLFIDGALPAPDADVGSFTIEDTTPDAGVYSYVYPVNNLGDSYTFAIKAQYLSKQTGFAHKYVTGSNKVTDYSLQAVGFLPNPVVEMDVERNAAIGDRVRLTMDLAGVTNTSGIAAADLKFKYITDKSVMTRLDPGVAETTIPASDFDSLTKNAAIPISVYTYYTTHQSSASLEENDVEFESIGVVNTDTAQFNPVLYTFAPQVKKVVLSYVGTGADRVASLVVTVEANDNVAPIEAVIMTHGTVGNTYTLTHDRDAQDNFVPVANVAGDYTYSQSSAAVGAGSLMLFSFICNNSKGLGVAKFGSGAGLAAGTYVRDVTAGQTEDSPFVRVP
jgi:hypothetical protein